MKATELMIGDWVLCSSVPEAGFCKVLGIDPSRKDPNDYLVEMLDQHGIRLWVYGRFIKPIPLTAEILKKNGFQWGYTSNEEDIQTAGEGDFEKGWVWDEGAGSVKVIFPEGTDSGDVLIDDQRFDKIVQFLWKEKINVHQLQHALRLCGIEHEIIL